MAIEKALGTENDPDIFDQNRSIEVIPEQTRQEQINDAAQILVNEEEVLITDEMEQEPMPAIEFDSNLVDYIDEDTLETISSDLLSSIKSDKQSRSEWEKTYTDGLFLLDFLFLWF